jgi:methylated-DNA-[protein]-cysteine S-methyltransferase
MRDLSCDEVVERLPALVAGDLDTREIQEIEFHTESCPECGLDLRTSRELSQALEALAGAVPDPILVPEEALAGLRHRIEAALPRIAAITLHQSAVGPIWLVATERGLAKIFFGQTEDDVMTWCHIHDLIPLVDEESLAPFIEQLDEYMRRERTEFDLPVDLTLASPFLVRVLKAAAGIPYGEVRRYQDVARDAGHPSAHRAVGNALKRNPLPIIFPCHRVIRSDGALGGYAGGLRIKEQLLQLEGALALP